MRALFFGTPEIAVPALRALAELAEVPAVICQPDRPAGRGLTLKEPAVKQAAKELGIAVHQPSRVKTAEFADWVRSFQADVALVMAYGRILPPAVLSAPGAGCMNLHASLLPKYRGAAPITWAVVKGEAQSGICLMQMDVGMDTGAVFCSEALPIGPQETAGELSERLGALAAEVVRTRLFPAVEGQLRAQPQDESQATYAPMLSKQDGLIPWQLSAQQVHDHVRGMSPWPGAFSFLGSRSLKVLRAKVHPATTELPPGTVLIADPSALIVACGQGALELLTVQLEGRKVLSARDFVAGRSVRAGDKLLHSKAV